MFALAQARLASALVALAALITAITAPGWHREHANHEGIRHAAHAEVHRATTHHACRHVHADHNAGAASAVNPAPASPDRDTPSLPPPHSHDEDGCVICLAINLPLCDGLPQLAIARVTSLLLSHLITPRVETPVVAFLPVLWTCGPPTAAITISCV